MNPLESRKLLLIAESDLNRAQFSEELTALTASVRTLAGRTKYFGTIVSSVMLLLAGLAAFRRGKPEDAESKPTRLQSLLKSAGLISTLWLAFRSRGRDQTEKQQ